jgi:aryl-alcohol dehydrogenase-like predicted oxidoreductase
MSLGGMLGDLLQELLLVVGFGDELAALHQVTAAQLFLAWCLPSVEEGT